MMENFAKTFYRLRFFLFGLVILLTIFFYSLIKIKIDNSLKAWFSLTDPDHRAYEEYRNTFEGGRFLIVVLRAENLFSIDILNYIKQKTEEFKDLSGVKGVHSLSNANKIIGTQDGIKINPLLAELETDDLPQIKKNALEDELFSDYLISSDGEITAIVINFEDMPARETDAAVCQVESLAYKGKPENLAIFFSGDMKMMAEFNRFTKQNQTIFPVLIIFIICIAIIILFRSLAKIFIILLVIGINICWTLGFYSILGYTFNVVTGMLIPLLIILSIADSIHIMEYFDEAKRENNKKEAFINTIKFITVPCFLTSITTAFGLISLSATSIVGVKRFGIGSAAGIMFAFVVTIIVIPLLLTLFPFKQKTQGSYSFESFLIWLAKFIEKRYKYILIMVIIGFIVFGWGITKVKVKTNQLEWFPKNGEVYKSAMLVDKNLSGTGNMEIIVKGKESTLEEPEILKRIDKLSAEIKKLPHVKKVISLADYVKRINKALAEDAPSANKIPEFKSLIAQELFLFTLSDDGREELQKIVTPDYSQCRIAVKTEFMPSKESVILGNLLKKMAKQAFLGTGVKVTVTGTLHMYNLLSEYILESQISSFSLAFLLVFGVLFVAFWSVKYGALSIIPDLLPVVFIIGLMGWVGIPLNTATVMIASVVLGITVDDTIHFISRFRKELKANRLSFQEAFRETIIAVGGANTFTSLINIAGFLILLISGFQPTREFGMLIAVTLFFALICDVFVLPSCLMAIRRFLTNGIR